MPPSTRVRRSSAALWLAVAAVLCSCSIIGHCPACFVQHCLTPLLHQSDSCGLTCCYLDLAGNSGGPLLDSKGRLIGINTAILDPSGFGISAGIGFAIPIDEARGLIDQLVSYGRVLRPALGVTLAPPSILEVRKRVLLHPLLSFKLSRVSCQITQSMEAVDRHMSLHGARCRLL